MSLSSFFNKQHASEALPYPLLYRMLRRWEVNRIVAAARLLAQSDHAAPARSGGPAFPDGGKTEGGERSLLDVGCGDGQLEELVADRFAAITACDVSPEAIARARRRAESAPWRDRVRWMVLDANQPLPFRNGEFSALACLSMLQYLFDPEEFLAEAFRVLEPGGKLVVEVNNVAFLPRRLQLLVGRQIRTSYYYKHGIDGGTLHYFTVRTIKALVRSAGFVIRRTTGCGVFAPLRTWWVSLLCGDVVILAEKPAAVETPEVLTALAGAAG